jgi:hypothetical protein
MTTALEPDDQLADDNLEELTRLALAADPDAPLDDDAVTIWHVLGAPVGGLLPSWYMPAPMGSGRRRRWSRRKRIVVLLVIVAFLAIDAAGLCSTYGNITIA